MSFIARYWSTTTRPLVGCVMQAQSSRFSHREDAEDALAAAIETNGDGCRGEVVESDLPPEIVRHCQTIQAIGYPCPDCGQTTEWPN